MLPLVCIIAVVYDAGAAPHDRYPVTRSRILQFLGVEMPSPSEYFTHVYSVSFASSNYANGHEYGYYTIGAALAVGATVKDVVGPNDPSSDDLTQLGDVQGDEFNLTNGQITVGASYDGIVDGPARGFVFYNANAGGYFLATDGTYDGGTVQVTYNTRPDGSNDPSSHLALCFASGTLIRTTRGDVPVEGLAVGDLAVTASGVERPIRWIGHRDIDCLAHPRPHDARPVRIAAHAFGASLPARDLYLSPGHPVLVGADEDAAGGHLVPVMCLINGTTIERSAADSVTYWHVELDAHDVLLAEGLPAESYLDWGDRAFFTEGSDHALANPDFVVPGLAGRCRPVALDGPVVEAERDRLDGVFAVRLAAACAWPDEVAALAL